MILIEHQAGEMDECTDLQICVFCGELLCDGQQNEVFHILRGHTPGNKLLKTKYGSVVGIEAAEILGEEGVIIPCTQLGKPLRFRTEKSRRK